MPIFRSNPRLMKKMYTLLVLLAATLSLQAQGVFSNKTTAALQKVIEDYPNRFKNIKGDRLSGNAQAVDYKSRVEIAGATACVITQYSATPKDRYNWSCELFQSADFDKAQSSFRELYNQIRNTIIKMEGERPFILNGKYENPAGEHKSTTVRFEFLPAPDVVQSLKVELTLQHTTDWIVVLTVYDQERHYDLALQQPAPISN
jgi:hypothetical protein